MRPLSRALPLLLSLTLCHQAAAAAAALELEVGMGGAALAPERPAFSARLGLDVLGHLTPSLRALAFPDTVGWREVRDTPGWALLAELRLHTGGLVQLTGGLAVGVAALGVTHAPDGQRLLRLTPGEPYLVGDVGVRVAAGPLWVGVGVHGSPSSAGPLGLVTLGWAPLVSR